MNNITEGNKALAKIFGERLTKRREQLSISQERLAELVAVSRESISKYETGKTTPNITVLLRIATTLNCSYRYLFGEDEYAKPEYEDVENLLGLTKESFDVLEQINMLKGSIHKGNPNLLRTINDLLSGIGYEEHLRAWDSSFVSTARVFRDGLLNKIDEFLNFAAYIQNVTFDTHMTGKSIEHRAELDADTFANMLILDINKMLMNMRDAYAENRQSDFKKYLMYQEHNKRHTKKQGDTK